MGVKYVIDGWEVMDSIGRGSNVFCMFDIQKARSGRGYLKMRRNTNGTLENLARHSGGGMQFAGADLIQVGNQGQVRCRFYVRACMLPTVNMALWSFSSGCQNGIVLKTDGTLTCLISLAGDGDQGAATSVAVVAITDNDYDKWYRLDYSCVISNVGSGAVDTIVASLTVTAPNGTSSTVGHNRTLNLGTPINISGAGFFDGLTAVGQADIDTDDLAVVAATNADVALADTLPVETRVGLILPSGQGSEAGWTGLWSRATKVVVDSTLNNRQVSGSSGLRTTFTHGNQPAANWGMTSIGGVMVTAIARGAAPTTPKFLVGGAAFDANTSVSTGLPGGSGWIYYCDFTTRTPAQLNALEFGLESTLAGVTDLYGIHMQVLYAGDAHSESERSTGGYKHKWMSWTGDGTEQRDITGVGFHPHAVLFCTGLQAAGSVGMLWRLADMPGRKCWTSAGGHEFESLADFHDDGFSIGLDINGVGNRYVALCIRDDGDGEDGRVFYHGGVAHPSANTQVQTFGYSEPVQLDLLFVTGIGCDAFIQTADFVATTSARMDTTTALTSDGIISRDTNGFTLGANTEFTEADDQRFWWGWKFTSALLGLVQVGKVVGQSAAAVVLTPGMNPYAVFLRGSNTTLASKRFHEVEYIGGVNSAVWISSPVTRTNAVIALDSAGGNFTIQGGAGAGIHLDDAPVVDCYWIAFHQEAEVAPPVEYQFDPDALVSIGLVWVEAFLPD